MMMHIRDLIQLAVGVSEKYITYPNSAINNIMISTTGLLACSWAYSYVLTYWNPPYY